MRVPLLIAVRYLIAKKQHNVINVISAISAVGMAIGTAAVILILSVYNGFNEIIDNNISSTAPDLVIKAKKGKCFTGSDTLTNSIYSTGLTASVQAVVEEKMFLVYGSNQTVARVKGNDSPELYRNEVPLCNVGQTVARKLGIATQFVTPLQVWYPDRTSKFSVSNPAESLEQIEVFPKNIIPANASDGDAVIIPLDKMRLLMHYSDEVSALEVNLLEPNSKKAVETVRKIIPEALVCYDKYQQNPSLYKMMHYEKAAIFLIMIFVVIIIAFNIFGSLSMLIIEKEEDIRTLNCMGATQDVVRRIFTLEGWMVSLTGLLSGLVTGLGAAFLQIRTGFLKLPGNYLLSSYPVVIRWEDIVATVVIVAAIGWAISFISTRRIKL